MILTEDGSFIMVNTNKRMRTGYVLCDLEGKDLNETFLWVTHPGEFKTTDLLWDAEMVKSLIEVLKEEIK